MILPLAAQGAWDKHDQTGPSPLIIHKEQLKAVAQPWLDFSLALKTDSEANAVLGWVLEMWGYVLAAGSLGIKHTVLPNFQIEPGTRATPCSGAEVAKSDD